MTKCFTVPTVYEPETNGENKYVDFYTATN